MDQEAFRQLVSTSSAVTGPSGCAPTSRTFGKAHKRSTQPASSSSTKPSDLKPRKHDVSSSNRKQDSYVDRAAARRSGTTSSEFGAVEALHRDFEERIAAAETEQERQMLRDQISSVGGDAKYSVLVKGLDLALLAQNKAKIERENGGLEAGDEGDLESVYHESKKGSSGVGGATSGTVSNRSRDEIVEAIKRRREGKTAVSSDSAAKNGPASGFRPIGFKPIGGSDQPQQEDTAAYKWVNGKRMRKKKKPSTSVNDRHASSKPAAVSEHGHTKGNKVDSQMPAKESTTPLPVRKQSDPSSSKNSSSEEALHLIANSEDTTKSDNKLVAASADNAPIATEQEDDDEDEDIFAGVGGWDGIPEKDSDNDASDQVDAPSPALVASKSVHRTPTPPPVANTAISADPVPAEEPLSPRRDFPPPPVEAPTPPTAKLELYPVTNTTPSPTHPSALSDPLLQTIPQPQLAANPPSEKSKPRKSKWDLLDKSPPKKKKKKHH